MSCKKICDSWKFTGIVAMTDGLRRIKIDSTNSHHHVWFCEKMGEWRWSLVWEDGSPSGGTHMHSGIASAEVDAYRDLAKTIMWIESKWPSEEYFEGGGG